jgi:hypothetical protein
MISRGPMVTSTYKGLDWNEPVAVIPGERQKSLLNYADLAQFLNTSVAWVRRNARRTYTSDPIPALRLGRNVLFDINSKEFLAWLKRRAGRAQ